MERFNKTELLCVLCFQKQPFRLWLLKEQCDLTCAEGIQTYLKGVFYYQISDDCNVSFILDSKLLLIFFTFKRSYINTKTDVYHDMSRNVRRRTFWYVHLTNTQISLRICAVGSESSLLAWRKFASFAVQNVSSEDSDQTALMRRLIWIFAWSTCPTIRFLTLRHISFLYKTRQEYSKTRQESSKTRQEYSETRQECSKTRKKYAPKQDKNTVKQDKSTVKQEKYAIKKDKNAVKQDKNAVKQDKSTVKQDKHTVKQDKHTVKQDKNTAKQDKNTVKKKIMQ